MAFFRSYRDGSSLRRELDGVLNQGGEDLLYPAFVGVHGRQRCGYLQTCGDSPILGLIVVGYHGMSSGLADIHPVPVKRDLAGSPAMPERMLDRAFRMDVSGVRIS